MSAPPAAPAAPDAASAEAPPARKPPLPTILAVVAGLALGGGAGAFAVGPAMAKGIAPAVAANRSKAPAHGDEAAEGEHGDAEQGEDGEEAAGDEEEEGGGEHGAKGKEAGAPVYTLDNLVLNPAQSGGQRFLLLTIAFELKDQATLDAMKARDAELRDVVLATAGAHTVEQLAEVAGRDSLKGELRAAAGKLFKAKKVRRVYFPQFVIQ